MIQQRTNVMNEERVEHLGDFLLVGEFEGFLEGNPDAF